MSEKQRQKKDGHDKNKKNQARRKADADLGFKEARSSPKPPRQRIEAGPVERRTEVPPLAASAPSAARMHASKTFKGK